MIHLDKFPKHWSERGKEKDLSYEKACEFLDYLYEDYEGYVAFDTETENLNKVHNNRLVSLQFAIDDKKGYVLCIDKPFTTFSDKELKVIKKKLVRLFESDKGNIIWIMHNAQFDIAQVVAQLKVKWVEAPVYDTQLFIHVLDENLVKKHDYSPLKAKASEFFKFNLYEKEAIEARGEGNLLALPKKSFITYAGMDAYVTMRLFLYLKEYAKEIDYWKKAQRLLKWIYSPALKSFSRISQNGFYIDKKQLKWLLSDESPVLGRLEEIRQYYFNDPKVKAVNEELSKANNNGMGSIFGYKTKWIFDINKPDHRIALFFKSKKGYRLKPIKGTSTDSEFQEAYRDTVEIVKIYEEEQELKKLLTSYMRPISRELATSGGDVVDGRVHPSFLLNGTVTGRISCCIRKGTKIEVVRDVSKYPEGINIEDVKPGDYVYCYDKNCKPTIRRVKNVVCMGRKELVRVKWISNRHHEVGHLDCTPDHRIRLVTGDYVRADELEKGDSVLSMSRDLNSLYFTNNYSYWDHRFVYRKLKGSIPEGFDIHHIDRNHYNNVPDNLECLSHSEHSTMHDNEKWSRPGYRENMSRKLYEYSMRPEVRKEKSRQAIIQGSDPAVRKYRSKCAKKQWENEEYRNRMTGVNSPVYRPLEDNFLEILFEYKGNVAEYARDYNWDWGTLRGKIKKEGVNADAIKLRFGGDGRRLTKKRIKKAIRKCGSSSIRAICFYLHIVPFRLFELLAFYNMKCGEYKPTKKERIRAKLRLNIHFKNNHKILKVKKLKFKDYVYDIEVEGCHNFIANGICVHNCHPNTTQIPRSDSYAKKAIKCMYAVEPNKGRCLLQADFCANEIRFWGLVSGDPNLCKAFNDSFKKGQEFRNNPTDEKLAEEAHLLGDIHKQTAAMMFDVDIKKVDKGLRQQSKGLSLGIMYQRGVHSVAAQLGLEVEEAQKKVDKFNNKFPVGCQWAEEQKKFVKKHGYVESPIGRRRNLQQEISIGNSYLEKSRQFPYNSANGKEYFRKGNAKIASAERFSVNAPIQGIANDVAMVSSAMLNEYIVKHDCDWLVCNTVHDSVVLDLPIKDLDRATKIIRKIFTIKNKEYMEKHFRWSMLCHIDIDFEISQWRAKKCKKCGKQYMYGLDKCECGCTEYDTVKLNSGYGSMVAYSECPQDLEIINKGLVEIDD